MHSQVEKAQILCNIIVQIG